MQPRFTIHARPAASSTTTSSALRPDGKESVTVRNHSGRVVRRALLIERRRLGAIDESFEHDGTIPNSGKRAWRDRQVVLNEIEFGQFCLAEK